MAFSFGTPAASTNQQSSAPSFSFGSSTPNTGGSLFGGQQNSTAPATNTFSFGNNNANSTNTQLNQSQAKPSFSFGTNSNTQNTGGAAPFSFGSAGGAGLFGQQNTAAPSGSQFGQSSTQPQPSSGLFGQPSTQLQPSSGLFGQNNTQNAGSGLFGNNISGNTNQFQQQGQSTGLFGQSTAQQPQTNNSGLFGSTFGQGQNSQTTGLFGQNNLSQQQQQQQQQAQQQQQQSQASQPTLAQSIYGQTLNQPQFSWSRTTPTAAQSTMPSFDMPTNSLALSRFNPSQTLSTSIMPSIPAISNPYGPSQPASIQDQLVRLKNAWDPTHPDCMFQAYFYNRVAPETASLYTKPEDQKQSAWDEAVAARPDNSVVPVLARGFTDLQARVQGQEQQIHAYRTRIHEIADKLKELNDRHLLHVTPKVDLARRRHTELSKRALQLAARVQVLKCRGYALRPEEEQLRTRLTALENRMKDPESFGRVEEIWAKMTLLRHQQRAMEEDIKARGYVSTINFEEGDALDQIQQVLRDHTNGLQYVSSIVKNDLDKVGAEIEKHRSAQAGSEKSKGRQ